MSVARRTYVVRCLIPGEIYSLEDGLGVRRVDTVDGARVESLELAPALASKPLVEQAIRTQASHRAHLDGRLFAPVKWIDRTGPTMRIVSEIPPGVRLSHLLAYLETAGEVPEAGMLELSALVINAVAALHAHPGGLAHGALSPAHVLLGNYGRVVLTDCVFGSGVEVLQRNREQLWREFGLAMPAAASLSRFDQQSDVTQMGAVVLAIMLQRPLRAAEYPHGVSDLILKASESSATHGAPVSTSALCTWLRQTLQIHPRLAFRSAVEAQRAFTDITNAPGGRPPGATALQMLLNTVCSEPPKRSAVVGDV